MFTCGRQKQKFDEILRNTCTLLPVVNLFPVVFKMAVLITCWTKYIQNSENSVEIGHVRKFVYDNKALHIDAVVQTSIKTEHTEYRQS